MITVDLRWLRVSGIGTYLRNTIPNVVARLRGQRFTLLGDPRELEYFGFGEFPNVSLVEMKAPMYSFREQIQLVRSIPKDTKLYCSPHYTIPLLYRGRMLVTVHDLLHLAMPELGRGLHRQLYARSMFGAVRRRATAIITISHFTKNELIRLTGEERREQPIIPVHLGVAEAWFKIPSGRKPYPGRYILYVGNVKPHKNLRALVKAFGSICDKVAHDLVIVGKKEGFITGDEAVAREARRLGGRVQFTGYVDDENLRQYFAHADALALPSLYEGFGLPPLEAMAAGCPVLVSTAGSLPEVCGDAAIYCDPYRWEDIASKLLGLLTDDAVRESLRRKGVEHARTFKWDRCIEQTCDVIRSLLAQDEPLPLVDST